MQARVERPVRLFQRMDMILGSALSGAQKHGVIAENPVRLWQKMEKGWVSAFDIALSGEMIAEKPVRLRLPVHMTLDQIVFNIALSGQRPVGKRVRLYQKMEKGWVSALSGAQKHGVIAERPVHL